MKYRESLSLSLWDPIGPGQASHWTALLCCQWGSKPCPTSGLAYPNFSSLNTSVAQKNHSSVCNGTIWKALKKIVLCPPTKESKMRCVLGEQDIRNSLSFPVSSKGQAGFRTTVSNPLSGESSYTKTPNQEANPFFNCEQA